MKNVPEEKDRTPLILTAHTRLGHGSLESVFSELWSQHFFWDTMRTDISKTLGSCLQCLRFNVPRMGYHPARHVTAATPWSFVELDLITMRPSARGHHYVLTIACAGSAFVVLAPLEHKGGLDVARAIYPIFSMLGPPATVQSDGGSEFTNAIIAKYFELAGVNLRFSAPYHPQSNGLVERAVGTVRNAILKLLEGKVDNWDLALPSVQFALNSRVSPRLKSAPFSLMFARASYPFLSQPLSEGSLLTNEEWEDRSILHNNQVLSIVYPAIFQRYVDAKIKGERKHRQPPTPILPNGTEVMVRNFEKNNKWDPKMAGPYRVISYDFKKNSYQLVDEAFNLYPHAVHIEDMRAIAPASHRDPSGQESYEVEYILDSKKIGGSYHYLVKWVGFPTHESTWEPFANLQNAYDSVRKYWVNKPTDNWGNMAHTLEDEVLDVGPDLDSDHIQLEHPNSNPIPNSMPIINPTQRQEEIVSPKSGALVEPAPRSQRELQEATVVRRRSKRAAAIPPQMREESLSRQRKDISPHPQTRQSSREAARSLAEIPYFTGRRARISSEVREK